jgi:chemotaxis protein MotB
MAKRRHKEEHVNHEAWAIPYGDLITLLLAFFVVMYAMSSVNEGKYRVLSDSLVAAFRSAPRSLEPIQVGALSRSMQDVSTERVRTLVPLELELDLDLILSEYDRGDREPAPREGESPAHDLPFKFMRSAGLSPDEMEEARAMIETITQELARELAVLMEEDLVRLRHNPFWIEIEINTSVLFDSASAELAPNSVPVLRKISAILKDSPTRIYVEGHTDSRPIHTVAFPSNWELSGARAASVVRLFAEGGVAPEQMAAVGLGEFRPVADNATPKGQQQNRRVVIVVMSAGARHFGEWFEGYEPGSGPGSRETPAPEIPSDAVQARADG